VAIIFPGILIVFGVTQDIADKNQLVREIDVGYQTTPVVHYVEDVAKTNLLEICPGLFQIGGIFPFGRL
jgi:hypothetical protein